MDAADGDSKPIIMLREDEEPEEEPELGGKLGDLMPESAAEAGTAALAAWGDAVGAWTGGGQGVWSAMLANAQVGMMAQGRLLVDPTLKTASSEVVRAALRGDVDGLRAALGDGHGALEARTSPAGETPLMLATISGNPDAVSYLRLIDSCITQLQAPGPCRTCNESKEEEEGIPPPSSPFLHPSPVCRNCPLHPQT